MQKEIWKDIPGYEGEYRISTKGTVLSLKFKRTKILKSNNSLKYPNVRLSIKNNTKSYKVHQLMAITFLGHNTTSRFNVVDHIDNNPKNNNIGNLQIISARDNILKDTIRGVSGFRNVYFNKKSGKWRSRVHVDGKRISLGLYDTPEIASRVVELYLEKWKGKK